MSNDLKTLLKKADGLKAEKPAYFAFIPNGQSGTLLINLKNRVPAADIKKALEEKGGSKPLIGQCFGTAEGTVFKVKGKVSSPKQLQTQLKETAKIAKFPITAIVPLPGIGEEDDDQADALGTAKDQQVTNVAKGPTSAGVGAVTAEAPRGGSKVVEDLQTALKKLGHDPGKIDGIIGRNTQKAIKEFQKSKGLPEDGYVGPATQKALDEAVAAAGKSVDGDNSKQATPAAATADAAKGSPEKYASKQVDDDEDEEVKANPKGPLGLLATVGRGGKNQYQDVLTIQMALNKRIKAGLPEDGKCDAKTLKAIASFQQLLGQFKPNGLFEPGRGSVRVLASSKKLGPPPEPPKPLAPPKLGPPSLAKAPAVWKGTREILKTNIAELKKGVVAHYGNEYPEVKKEIDENLKKLGVILEKLDNRLADSLDKANATKDDAERKAELKYSKTLLAGYIQYVKTEPMIAHVDANPFGVATELRKVLIDALTHVAKAIS